MESLNFISLFLLFKVITCQPGQNPGPDDVIVIQDLHGRCNNIWNPLVKKVQERNRYQLLSHAQELNFYERGQDCVVTLIGKLDHQWSIRIQSFDVYGQTDAAGIPINCYDYVKFYDAERCDNAKLLKGIDFRTGLCGTLSETQIGTLEFTTCANVLTIQFFTDITKGSIYKNGFSIELTQYLWTNPTGGPDCDFDLNGIAAGVWRDGTFNEFQNTWSDQPVIPGYVEGGNEANYDKEIDGITCYECVNCPVEPFEPEKDGTATDTGCYRCSKEWDQEYQVARRKCYSRVDYTNFIEALREINEPFIGCRQSVDDFSRTRNYCFCDTDLCNEGTRSFINYITMCSLVLVTMVLRLL
ncbi:uncharacterized protein LOC128237243 [Mya arenaria]|uniref:uncharacterized protein LOC128237243 n=1 Tax=Mya arenaria TaxID=6604 RepID=UPI0022E1ABE2|nr:uncharacterized protein LOC128237243 [Mya arenaria]